MRCERCNERPATVHVTRVINGEKSEQHLCDACAKQQGEAEFGMQEIPFQSILAGFFQDLSELGGGGVPSAAPGAKPAPASIQCPKCGLSLQAFRKTGLLGCPECYEAFSDRLEPLLRRLHGAVQHKGRLPARQGAGVARQNQLNELRKALQEAVQAEEFERAAELRDKIRALTQEGGGRS